MLHEWRPLLSHCPGWGCFGAPGRGRRGPNRCRSMDAAPAGWGVRDRSAQRWPEATKASLGPARNGQCSSPPCPLPYRSSEHPSGGWRPASAWRRCTLPPPRGQSSLLRGQKWAHWRKCWHLILSHHCHLVKLQEIFWIFFSTTSFSDLFSDLWNFGADG